MDMSEEHRSKPADNFKSRGRKMYTPKKPVNYVPRGGRSITPANPQPDKDPELTKETHSAFEARKRELLSCYRRRPEVSLLEPWVKTMKDIYSDEPLEPESAKTFTLPMEHSIMPPRKTRPPQGREVPRGKDRQGGYEDRHDRDFLEDEAQDQGMVVGTSEKAAPLHSAPLWFNGEGPTRPSDALEGSPGFSMEELEQRQNKLEEEKAKYLKSTAHSSGPLQSRPTEYSFDSVVGLEVGTKLEKPREARPEEKKNLSETATQELEQDCRYSTVDELFEQKLKTNSVADIFAQAEPTIGDDKVEKLNAISLQDLEATMLKGSKAESKKAQEGSGSDSGAEEGEPAPQWNQFSAEEIKQQTQQEPDRWHRTPLAPDQSIPDPLDGPVASPMTSATAEQELTNRMTGMLLNRESQPQHQPQLQSQSQFQFQLQADPRLDPSTQPAIEAGVDLGPEMMREPQAEALYDAEPEREASPNPFLLSPLGFKEDDPVWFYKDLQGHIQGPFSSREMHTWHNTGYFPPALLLRCGKTGMFVSLEIYLHTSIQERSNLFSTQTYNQDPRYHYSNYPPAYGYTPELQPASYTLYHSASPSPPPYPMAYRVSYPIASVPMHHNPQTHFNMQPMAQGRMGLIAGGYPVLRVPARMQYFPQPTYRPATYIYGTAPPNEGEVEGDMRADPRAYPGQDLYDPHQRPPLS